MAFTALNAQLYLTVDVADSFESLLRDGFCGRPLKFHITLESVHVHTDNPAANWLLHTVAPLFDGTVLHISMCGHTLT